MSDATGQIVYNYDNMGRLTSSLKTIDGVTYPFNFNYSLGRLNTITYPDNDTVTYAYDTAGNIKNVGAYVIYSNYDALGRWSNAAHGAGGASTLFTYDNLSKRLTGLSVLSPGQGLLINNNYAYDNTGNITSISDLLDSTRSLSYTYDLRRISGGR